MNWAGSTITRSVVRRCFHYCFSPVWWFGPRWQPSRSLAERRLSRPSTKAYISTRRAPSSKTSGIMWRRCTGGPTILRYAGSWPSTWSRQGAPGTHVGPSSSTTKQSEIELRHGSLCSSNTKTGILMSLNKGDVWADLRYALDELDRQPRDIHSRLTEAADLDAQPDAEFHNRLLQIGLLSIAYGGAASRAKITIAHEAVEKGLKAILIDVGLSEQQVRSRSHELHLLLTDVQQHHPTAFNALERCFDSTIQYLESVTPIKHNTNIIDYFEEHGKSAVFIENRYESIEGRKNTYGMIGRVYMEIIRALLSLLFGWTPNDINARIEEEAKKAILAESERDPAWNAAEWLSRGPVRPRLEVSEDLNNKVLRAALRRCTRESKDSGIQHWAQELRRNRIAARRKARLRATSSRGAEA